LTSGAARTLSPSQIQVKTAENEILVGGLQRRGRAIDKLRDKNGVFIDPGGVHEGVEKLEAIVQLLFTQFEDYVFSVRGPGQSMHGVGRLPWSYGPPDDPQRMTGTDVGVTKDGKLTALYVFIDPPSQK